MDRLVRTFTVASDYTYVTRPSVGTSGPLEIMANIDSAYAGVNALLDTLQMFTSMESPAEDDTRVLFRARTDLHLKKLVSALIGTDTPTVTWKLETGASLAALANLTPAIVTSSVTTGDEEEGGEEVTPWTGPDGNGEYYAALIYEPNAVYLDGDTLGEGTVGELETGEYGWTSDNGGRLYLPADPEAAVVLVNDDGYFIAEDDFVVLTVTATSGSPSQLLVDLQLEPVGA